MSEYSKEQLLEEANQLAGTMTSPGWKVIENEVARRKETLTRALIGADDIDTIKSLQANIRSLEFLVRFPAEMLETANKVSEQDSIQPNAD